MTDASGDLAPLVAAEYIASAAGGDAIREAEALFDGGAPAHNALARLSASTGRLIGGEAARAAASLAWTQAILRARAAEKLGTELGGLALFDSDGLQMSSGIEAAEYHAMLARRSGATWVIDLTAGIGIDALAFARAGLSVVACERDAARATLLRANVKRAGFADKITVRSVDSLAEDADFTGAEMPKTCVFLDPPRRTEQTRWGNLDAADALLARAAQLQPAAIIAKLSPAVERVYGAPHSADISFVSVAGECREAVLTIGAARLHQNAPPTVSAVLLPSRVELSGDQAASTESALTSSLQQRRYLVEPDAAVIRAGLVGNLARQIGYSRFDPEIAYLAGDAVPATPFGTGYRILAAFPYHRREAQAWLDARGATHLVVKKRGVPDEPEVVRKQFKLKAAGKGIEASAAILAITRQGKQRWALFLDRV